MDGYPFQSVAKKSSKSTAPPKPDQSILMDANIKLGSIHLGPDGRTQWKVIRQGPTGKQWRQVSAKEAKQSNQMGKIACKNHKKPINFLDTKAEDEKQGATTWILIPFAPEWELCG